MIGTFFAGFLLGFAATFAVAVLAITRKKTKTRKEGTHAKA